MPESDQHQVSLFQRMHFTFFAGERTSLAKMAAVKVSLPAPIEQKFNHYGAYVVANSVGKLLPHQMHALQKLQTWFKNKPNQIALTAMPTGSGKTGVICCLPYFLGALKNASDERVFEMNKPILVIAPNLEIASQLEKQVTISSDDPGANFICSKRGILPKERKDALPKGIKIEKTEDLRNPLYLQMNDIVIANAQKFLKGEWERALGNDLFQMVIVDEAHHFPAPTWRRIIEKFKEHALVAFFTATPFRTDRKPVVKGPLAYRLTLDDAVRQRIIRETRLDPPLSTRSDATIRFLDDVFRPILKRVRKLQDRKNANHPLPNNIPHMALAITKDTMEADRVQELWNALFGDDSAIAYHSDVGKVELGKRMKRLKENQVKLVVVVEMLKEGFDHPPISIAVIMTRISSPLKFTQFVGRAQRIVRTPQGNESNGICADVVTHSHFEQKENFRKFESEELIELADDLNQLE